PRGLASAEQVLDLFVFFRSEAVLTDHLRRNGSDHRGGHQGIFIVASRLTFRMWIRRNQRRKVTSFRLLRYASAQYAKPCRRITGKSPRRTKLGKKRDASRRGNGRRHLRTAHDLQWPLRLFPRRVRLHY